MPTSWVTVDSTYNAYWFPRGPYLHQNTGQTGDEHLFMPCIVEDTGPTLLIRMFYSSDYGETWSNQAIVTLSATSVGDAELTWDVASNRLHLVWSDSGTLSYMSYNMDTIATGSTETIDSFTTEFYDWCLVVARSDTDASGNGLGVIYHGERYRDMGSGYAMVWGTYKRSNAWGTPTQLSTSQTTHYWPIALMRDDSQEAWAIYGNTNATYERKLNSSDGWGGEISGGSFATDSATSWNRENQSRVGHHSILDGSSVDHWIIGDDNGKPETRTYYESGSLLANDANVEVAALGDMAKISHSSVNNDAWVAYHVAGELHLEIYVSTDEGATWTVDGQTDDASNSWVGSGAQSADTYVIDTTGDEIIGFAYDDPNVPALYFNDYIVVSGVETKTVTHTTDAAVGLFVNHTTDAVPAITSPTETTRPIGGGGQLSVYDGTYVWMVGTENSSEPDTIKLWQGSQGGTGLWDLHEFTHGTGTNMLIRDIAIAEVNGIIHVIYVHHDYGGDGDIGVYHIEYDPVGDSWTDNGQFGYTGDSHPDVVASAGSRCDVTATSDDELVVFARTYNYINFAGSTTYRTRHYVYRSNNLSFTGVTNHLWDEAYGVDAFSRPSTPAPKLASINTTDAWLIPDGYSRYTSSETESVRKSENRSAPYGGIEGIDHALPFGTTDYITADTVNIGAFMSFTAKSVTGTDLLVFPNRELHTYFSTIASPFSFIDHYGNIGWSFEDFNDPDDRRYIYISNGMGQWFESTQYDPPSLNNPWYVLQDLPDGTWTAWEYNASGPWTFHGQDIPTWFRAHSTDAILTSQDGAVSHSTDAQLTSGAWGGAPGSWRSTDKGGINNWFTDSGNYYIVTTGESHLQGNHLAVFESSSPHLPGSLLTEWSVNDISGYTGPERIRALDFIVDTGVMHFVFLVWDNSRYEAHHSTYTISTDTWVHNGSFHNGTTGHKEHSNVTITLAQRSDGDMIAFYYFDHTDDYFYSINTGAGFGTGTSMSRSTGQPYASICTDTNDTHMLSREGTTLYHWRLSSTDVLGSMQTTTTILESSGAQGTRNANPIVHNGRMFVWSMNNSRHIYVTHAATGSDAPTWTKDQITSVATSRLRGMLPGVGGAPTVFWTTVGSTPEDYKVWYSTYDGASWNNKDTGQYLNVLAQADLETSPTNDLRPDNATPYGATALDSDGHALVWWPRQRFATDGVTDEPLIGTWEMLRINLNPLEWHTTDAELAEIPTVTHTTDALVISIETLTHTTDAHIVTEGNTISINHTTDSRVIDRLTIDHTTDSALIVRTNIDHTTDAELVHEPHDLSTTVTFTLSITPGLQEGTIQTATGLGKHKTGDHRPKIYTDPHKFIRKR